MKKKVNKTINITLTAGEATSEGAQPKKKKKKVFINNDTKAVYGAILKSYTVCHHYSDSFIFFVPLFILFFFFEGLYFCADLYSNYLYNLCINLGGFKN